MRIIFLIFAVSIFCPALLYLSSPSPSFPLAPPDSVQSLEEADTEYLYRRAYFTNFDREQVLNHYQNALGTVKIFGFSIPSYRLNYPPEDAYSIIRDQTRSTFLEEIVHPFRESIYVNGFKPKFEKDDIWYKGVHYEQKITVRYVPSNREIRIIVFSVAFILLILTLKEFTRGVYKLIRELV